MHQWNKYVILLQKVGTVLVMSETTSPISSTNMIKQTNVSITAIADMNLVVDVLIVLNP